MLSNLLSQIPKDAPLSTALTTNPHPSLTSRIAFFPGKSARVCVTPRGRSTSCGQAPVLLWLTTAGASQNRRSQPKTLLMLKLCLGWQLTAGVSFYNLFIINCHHLMCYLSYCTMPQCVIITFLSSVKGCELVQGHIYNVPAGGSLNKNTLDILPDWQSCKAHCEDNYTAAIFFTFRELYDIQNCYCLPSYSSITENHLWTSGKLHCENTGNTTMSATTFLSGTLSQWIIEFPKYACNCS